ncbi:transposase [Calothrix sp. NIES-3974]|nr:transposase [Calothrix sp. NIES-3974]
MPVSASDVRALNSLPLNLPPGSEIYADSAYTDYTTEDDLGDSSEIKLKVMRKRILSVQISRGFNI